MMTLRTRLIILMSRLAYIYSISVHLILEINKYIIFGNRNPNNQFSINLESPTRKGPIFLPKAEVLTYYSVIELYVSFHLSGCKFQIKKIIKTNFCHRPVCTRKMIFNVAL
jgi:hypothetical protein